eukprot:2065772-Rhodomonas_salina.2
MRTPSTSAQHDDHGRGDERGAAYAAEESAASGRGEPRQVQPDPCPRRTHYQVENVLHPPHPNNKTGVYHPDGIYRWLARLRPYLGVPAGHVCAVDSQQLVRFPAPPPHHAPHHTPPLHAPLQRTLQAPQQRQRARERGGGRDRDRDRDNKQRQQTETET